MPSLGLVTKYPRPYRGVLHKKGHLVKSWKSREFVLSDNILCYKDKGVEKGRYIIDASSTVSKEEDIGEFTNVFILSTTKGELIMSAPSEEIRCNWMELIEEVIKDGVIVEIPDILVGKFVTTVTMQLTFPGSNLVACDGNMLSPAVVRRAPVVAYKASPSNKLCTLVAIDPDAPSKAEPIYREFVHWVVVNIPGTDVSAGDTVAPYVGAAPPYNSGVHRYFFFLYEQPAPLSRTDVNNLLDYFVRRGGFTLSRWASRMGFSHPIAVQGFHSKWDEYVDEVHNEMRFMPPAKYRSPSQTKAMIEFNALEKKMKEQQAYDESGREGAMIYEHLEVQDILGVDGKGNTGSNSSNNKNSNNNSSNNNNSNNNNSNNSNSNNSSDSNLEPRVQHLQLPIPLYIKYTFEEVTEKDVSGDHTTEKTQIETPFILNETNIVSTKKVEKLVTRGCTMTPTEVQHAPIIKLPKYIQQDKFYTLIMTDPDAPSRQNPFRREFIHWVVVDIPGHDVVNSGTGVSGTGTGNTKLNSKDTDTSTKQVQVSSIGTGGQQDDDVMSMGTTVASYIGSGPPYRSGPHRYIFLLYEQQPNSSKHPDSPNPSGKLTEKQLALSRKYLSARGGLCTAKWVKETITGTGTGVDVPVNVPLGVAGFTAEWDKSVDQLHNKLNFIPPPEFQSPSQQIANNTSFFGHKKEKTANADALAVAASLTGVGSKITPKQVSVLKGRYPYVFDGDTVVKRSDTGLLSDKRWVWIYAGDGGDGNFTLNWAKNEEAAKKKQFKSISLVACKKISIKVKESKESKEIISSNGSEKSVDGGGGSEISANTSASLRITPNNKPTPTPLSSSSTTISNMSNNTIVLELPYIKALEYKEVIDAINA